MFRTPDGAGLLPFNHCLHCLQVAGERLGFAAYAGKGRRCSFFRGSDGRTSIACVYLIFHVLIWILS